MKRHLLALGLFLSALGVFGAATAATPDTNTNANAAPVGPVPVAFSLIKTSQVSALEGFTYVGGSFFKSIVVNHIAVLVRHGQESFLFDSGLGQHIEEQYRQDMPLWARPFFRYQHPVNPARTQLDRAGYGPISRIILSHGHWDHASGLVDFPEAEVWMTPAELEFVHHPETGTFASQFASPSIRYHSFTFEPKPYEGFAQSLDLFHDGSAVLVPLPGHTPGSVGLFLTTSSGRHFLFCGDLVWNAKGFENGGRPKATLASLIVDHDRPETLRVVQQVAALMQAQPDLTVVPAHDSTVQDKLGYFPNWVQ